MLSLGILGLAPRATQRERAIEREALAVGDPSLAPGGWTECVEAAPGIAGGQGQINTVGKLSLLLKRKSVGVSTLRRNRAAFLVLWKQENRLLLVIWDS